MYGNFFAGKRILVTGAAGVKGTWMAMQLLDAGSKVIGLDIREPQPDSNFVASGLDSRIEFVRADVNDLAALVDLVSRVDGVFHLAAVSLVHQAKKDPFETYRSNTMGTVAVLEALRRNPSVRYAVIATTDKVYKPKGGEPWVEDDALFASQPYPVSKACAETIVADYVGEYLAAAGQKIGVVRAGNVLLGGDPYSSSRLAGGGHLHVDCFEALFEGRQPVIFSPDFTRPYTYGLDIISGYLSLMARLDDPEIAGTAFNFGPQERAGLPNSLLASKICELWGSGVRWKQGPKRSEPFEKQSMNCDRSRKMLGWHPAFSVDETLAELTKWYREWYGLQGIIPIGCMADFNHRAIERHREAAKLTGNWWASSI